MNGGGEVVGGEHADLGAIVVLGAQRAQRHAGSW
jgi:hypothetical protein